MLSAWWSISALVASSAQTAPVVPFGDKGEIHICSDTIIRVTHRPSEQPVSRDSLIARTDWPQVEFSTTTDGDLTIVETSKLSVKLSAAQGSVTFEDKATGKVLLRELETTFMPSQDLGHDAFQVEQSWAETSPTEGLFGGGSYQNGIVNFKNAPVEMIQYNTEAVVPFFTSTEGYGLLWDNYAWTYLNPPTEAIVPPGSSSSGTISFTPQASGDHFFFVGKAFPQSGDVPIFGHGTQQVYVTLSGPDGQEVTVQSWDSLTNMPNSLTGRAPGLKEGVEYSVQYFWSTDYKGETMRELGLFVQGPEYGKTALRSFLGELVDYYFVYGETFDGSIAGYRDITGAAPLYGKWVYGFWQCKEHYATQHGLLEAAHGFRNRSIPVDAFVQDWHYWGDMGWGPQWDPKVYPDPAAMVEELRSIDIHLMVSVWSKFDKSTSFWKQMNDKGWILGNTDYYDPFDADARELYYNFSKDTQFSIGVDSLWQDGTEPEDFPNANEECALGSCNAYMNAYSLQTTRAIADGLRRDYGDAQGARVFTLSRSSFAAQQTTGATVWTGDISGKWDSLRRQISSAINYQMSGIPYWAQDIGGFYRPGDQYNSADYHDMLTRWFQFGVFTPIFRVHGGSTNTELWNFGDDVMNNINSSTVSLRYRLLPYTYSGFARVEEEGYTMLRGLPMDFPEDAVTYAISDEFMYGDAFLVTPIYSAGTTSAEGQCSDVSKDVDYDRSGGDYAAAPASSADSCAQRCCDDVRCLAYSFGTSPGGQSYSSCRNGEECCWLKDTAVAKSSSSGHVSGVAQRKATCTTPTLDEGMDREGGDYAAHPATDAGECAQRCCDDAACRAFSFGPGISSQSYSTCSDGEPCCMQKDSQPNKKANSGHVSGVVHHPVISTRSVYFPAGHWIEFHSGEQVAAGSRNVSFPLEQAPVFVKAGSIVALGPKMQHSFEKAADPIELRVYPGGDASFTLFEDDGKSTAYQKGAKATITFAWSEAKQEMSIMDRHGSFDGMLQNRTFNVIFVRPGHGVGVEETAAPDKVVAYSGKAVSVKSSLGTLLI